MSMRWWLGLLIFLVSVGSADGKLRLSFEQNRGQADASVHFLTRGPGYTLHLTQGGAVMALRHGDERALLRTTLVGGSETARVAGAELLPGRSHYFIGSNPEDWRVGIPTYARVEYEDVYPGVDLVYYGNQRQVEYDFVVESWADPSAIVLAFDGDDGRTIDPSGDLLLCVGDREVRLRRPVAYQLLAGKRQPVAASYRLTSHGVTFDLGAFNPALPLVIDPVIVYSTYFDSGTLDRANGIAVDAAGNAIIAGGVATIGPGGSSSDAFVAKLSADGSHLIYSTVLGGSAYDEAYGVAADAAGNVYVTGFTESATFPVTAGAFDTAHAGATDVFVTRLSPDGSTLLYSTFLGGTGAEAGQGVDVDAAGIAWVSGVVTSTDFPTTPGAFQTTPGSLSDAFATRLDASGSSLLYSTYLGGSGYEDGRVAVDAAGNAWVAGGTASPDFPVTAGAFQTTHQGSEDGFVARFAADGSGLVWATYVGGSRSDVANGIAVDAGGSAYVVGTTTSFAFPTTPGAWDATYDGSASDLFVTKLDASGASLAYSTYLGGSSYDQSGSIAVDSAGSAWVVAQTHSADFPVTRDVGRVPDTNFSDAVVTKLDAAGTNILGSTFLGGSRSEWPAGIALDGAGDAYVTGYTFSSDFPTTPGALQPVAGALEDAFVTKMTMTVIPDRQTVAIEIEPGSPFDPPIIKLKSNRPTEVTILSTADLDALTQVARSSLTFGRTGDEPSLARCNPGKVDVNHDKRPDLVCTFTTALTGFQPGDTVGVLRGLLNDGTEIEGTDAIRVID